MERTELGPYRLLRRLGAGGMGEVYLAERAASGSFRRRCCVKLVLPHLARRQEITELFEREAVLAGRVSHENVVQVFDYGRIDDIFYLAMEYIDGVTARRMLIAAQERGLEVAVPDACAIIADVARGLAAVHALVSDDGKALNVVHRDITPDNILVTRDGLAKLGDFGIAVAEDSTRITQTGELRGKMPYMSPEQLDGGEVTQASDVFMLGVSLYQLLAGRRPFDRGTDLGTMNAIVLEPAPPLERVPKPLAHIVAQMLDKDPKQRPPARDVTDAILRAVPQASTRPKALVELALSSTDITLPPTEPPTSVTEPSPPPASNTLPERRPQNRALAIVIGATLALALGAGSAALVLTKEERVEPVVVTPPPPPPAAPPAPAAAPPTEPPPIEEVVEAPAVAIVPTLHLVGPAHVRWSSLKGKPLGAGEVRVKLAATKVIATDPQTSGRSVVPVVAGVARYDALGTGTLDVRAEPYANVTIGTKSLGMTPLKPAPQLVAGTYRVKLECEGREKIEQVEIHAGQVARVRADLSGK